MIFTKKEFDDGLGFTSSMGSKYMKCSVASSHVEEPFQ